MATDDEVVVPESSIPVRMLRGDELDVVPCNVLQWIPCAVVSYISVGGDGLHADGNHKNMRLLRISGSELADLHQVNDDALDSEDPEALAVVEQRGISLLIYVHF